MHTRPAPQASPVSGDLALAQGALAAQVQFVAGYPGSPGAGVFNALLNLTQEINIHWAPNEKVAMEAAFGASLAGSRSLVILKSVGMNVALDPLATFSLSGCHAGLVILVGDDPGAWASQNEQDSRWLARLAEVPVVEPTSVEQAALLMVQAFAWSESLGLPMIIRTTRALHSAKATLPPLWELPTSRRRFLRQRNHWIVLPYLVQRRHATLHSRLRKYQAMLEASPYDVSQGSGALGIIASGFTYSKLLSISPKIPERYQLLALSSSWPLPQASLTRWLAPLKRALILEEGAPFVEEQIRALAQRENLEVELLGRETRTLPEEGGLLPREIINALHALDPAYSADPPRETEKTMPSTVPLCEDCPYRPTFHALLEAMEALYGRQHYIVVGEPGCMVRANLSPFQLFDVKYSLGSGLATGLGLALCDKQHHIITLLGDSSFFHSGLNALPFALQQNPPLTMIILDNRTTALTGGQTHPGSSFDERGQPRTKVVDIARIIQGIGGSPQVLEADSPSLKAAFQRALTRQELQILIIRAPCPRYTQD